MGVRFPSLAPYAQNLEVINTSSFYYLHNDIICLLYQEEFDENFEYGTICLDAKIRKSIPVEEIEELKEVRVEVYDQLKKRNGMNSDDIDDKKFL
jgi:hypothetical protein